MNQRAVNGGSYPNPEVCPLFGLYQTNEAT